MDQLRDPGEPRDRLATATLVQHPRGSRGRSSSPARHLAAPLEPPARPRRRHRQRARPRRPPRPQRAVPRAELLRLGLEPARIAIVGDDPAELEAALARGPRGRPLRRLRAASGRRTTTARSSSWRVPRGASCSSTPGLEAEIEAVSRAIAERLQAAVRGLRGRRPQAGDPARGRGRRSVSPARRRPSCSRRRARSSSCFRGRRPSCSGLWPRALETEPVQAACSRARDRPSGACCASTARASRRSRGRSRRRAERAPGWTATICARDFEIHVDLFVDAGGGQRADELATRAARAARQVPVRRGRARRSRRSCSSSAASAG